VVIPFIATELLVGLDKVLRLQSAGDKLNNTHDTQKFVAAEYQLRPPRQTEDEQHSSPSGGNAVHIPLRPFMRSFCPSNYTDYGGATGLLNETRPRIFQAGYP
jgi:hypothetical protein